MAKPKGIIITGPMIIGTGSNIFVVMGFDYPNDSLSTLQEAIRSEDDGN
jgi:hypothetical protein